jgi:hypothetical protein
MRARNSATKAASAEAAESRFVMVTLQRRDLCDRIDVTDSAANDGVVEPDSESPALLASVDSETAGVVTLLPPRLPN